MMRHRSALRLPSGCRCAVSLSDAAPPNGRVDPTGTGAERKAWERGLIKRFRNLKRQIRTAILTLDVLGLKPDPAAQVSAATFQRAWAPLKTADGAVLTRDAAPLSPRQFVFERPGEKVASFMEWLREASREGILEVQLGTSISSAAQTGWQNVYIDTAYQRGIREAGKRTRMGASALQGAFNQPIHADAVGLIYTRAYEQLAGVTDTMAQQISRSLAQGLAEGRGALAMARALEERVDAIGITRARAIAQTETISAYAEATLNTYEEAGLSDVNVVAEFLATDDNVVCPICEDMQGNRYSLDEARGLIPVHVNCRCAWAPVVE